MNWFPEISILGEKTIENNIYECMRVYIVFESMQWGSQHN